MCTSSDPTLANNSREYSKGFVDSSGSSGGLGSRLGGLMVAQVAKSKGQNTDITATPTRQTPAGSATPTRQAKRGVDK